MKTSLNFILAKHPKIYEKILRLNRNFNLDKILFLNLIQEGDMVFDIGANVGYYTILFSHLVGKTGEVHAFEPLPSTFEVLSKEVNKQKKYDNVYLNNTAVSDINGIMNIYLPENDHRQASLTRHKAGSWLDAKNIKSYECKVIKLDEYMQAMSKQRLDFIKLDVEGAEMLALNGFHDLIRRFLPIIYLEIFSGWTENFNYKPVDIVEFLMSLGYLKFYLVKDKISALKDPLKELLEENFSGPANLLCVISGNHDLRINRLIK